jgi:LysM repeat protein
MRLQLMTFTFALISLVLSGCGRWAPGYIITQDGTMLSNSDVNYRDVTVQNIRSELDKQIGEHWRTQIDLPELPIYESDDRHTSSSWMWEKITMTVTLVGDDNTPPLISEKEIQDEIQEFMYQKIYQPKKNLSIIVIKKIDAALFATLCAPSKPPLTPSKTDASQIRHYTVQVGDTWADISQAFYGSTQHWRLLSEANHGGDLPVGRELLIPVKP